MNIEERLIQLEEKIDTIHELVKHIGKSVNKIQQECKGPLIFGPSQESNFTDGLPRQIPLNLPEALNNEFKETINQLIDKLKDTEKK